jgi:predicted DCC family thiol-disulfide oxidoreductase YuxK
MSEAPRAAEGASIILYDGVCGLCHRLNRFVLTRDPAGRFRFAALQSVLAREILTRHGRDPRDLDTLYLVLGYGRPDECLLRKSEAALWILGELDGPWRAASGLRVVPRRLRDLGYDLVAHTRYRLFGRFDACPVPDARHRARFLGDEVPDPDRPDTSRKGGDPA